MIYEKGEINLNECDEMNIPVNMFLIDPKDNDEDHIPSKYIGKWYWCADNFMPRKCTCVNCSYEVYADTKKELIEYVHKYVLPLYEIALKNIKNKCENYYWE